MRIYSWNVNGIRAISKKNFFSWIDEEKPDILCVQETKLQENDLDEKIKNIDGYYSFFSFAERKGYSGVATYSKVKPISCNHGFGIEKFDSEGRILETEFEEFTLLNIYFPNGQKDEERLKYKMDFYEAFLKYANDLVKSGKKLIICGDYNTAHTEMDIKNAKANSNTSGFLPMERQWIDKYIENGYYDSYRYINPEKVQYSWWSYRFKARERDTGWRIDYHFVSKNLIDRVKNAEILTDVFGSDHCPIMVDIE